MHASGKSTITAKTQLIDGELRTSRRTNPTLLQTSRVMQTDIETARPTVLSQSNTLCTKKDDYYSRGTKQYGN